MANNCYYEMKIVGTKENCSEWISRMRMYENPNHFCRIFCADVYDDGGEDDQYYMLVNGDCAWSLESCCRASGYSGGRDLFSVNTKELSLKMEAYSEEPGMSFQEHYVYDNGDCIVCETTDFNEYWWDKTDYPNLEDFKKDYHIPDDITEEDFDEGMACRIGGFQSWEFSI